MEIALAMRCAHGVPFRRRYLFNADTLASRHAAIFQLHLNSCIE